MHTSNFCMPKVIEFYTKIDAAANLDLEHLLSTWQIVITLFYSYGVMTCRHEFTIFMPKFV
jgi:hypothetical protein